MTTPDKQPIKKTKLSKPVIAGLIAIIFISVIVIYLFFINSKTENLSVSTNEIDIIENQKADSNKKSLLSELLSDEKNQETNKTSLLSKLIGSDNKTTETNKNQLQPVDLYYTIEPGEAASIAYFYVSSVSTPVQGVQIVVNYSGDITPTSVESSIRFPDLVKQEINTTDKTFFALASIGKDGQPVTGSYPIFSLIFEGKNPNFKINREKTIVATNGQAIPFNIIDQE